MTSPQAVRPLTAKANILANTRLLLNRDNDMGNNHGITNELAKVFAEVGGVSTDEDINDWCNADLGSGVAISPILAAKCLRETLRTQLFMKGLYDCLSEMVKVKKSINIVYAGTGPYGCLLLPLLVLFPQSSIRVWLIDIHQENIDSIEKIVRELEVEDQIAAIEKCDATKWHPSENVKFDLILSETMTALLGTEPQVAIFAHLQRFLSDDGVLIPQQIVLSSKLMPFESSKKQALSLGEFFCLNQKTAEEIADGDVSCLQGNITLPKPLSSFDYQTISFFTDIHVFGSHQLSLHQCSLNTPVSYSGLKLEPGGLVHFHYLFNARPKFEFIFPIETMVERIPSTEELGSIELPGVKRFWHKTRLVGEGRHDRKTTEKELSREMDMLAHFGKKYQEALYYICHFKPEFHEFERWLLSENE